jgi:hypothetical protein
MEIKTTTEDVLTCSSEKEKRFRIRKQSVGVQTLVRTAYLGSSDREY